MYHVLVLFAELVSQKLPYASKGTIGHDIYWNFYMIIHNKKKVCSVYIVEYLSIPSVFGH